MKKIKKILAAVMTLAMVLGMSMTTFAADHTVAADGSTASITVMGLEQGDTVNIYKVVSWDAENGEWDVEPWAAGTDAESQPYVNIATSYINWAGLRDIDGTATVAQPEKTADANGEVTFSNLDIGAYLLVAAGSNKEYNAMGTYTYIYDTEGEDASHLMVPANVTIAAKGSSYGVTKTLGDGENGFAFRGDSVEFDITTVFPSFDDVTENAGRTFTITDTPSGMQITGVTVTVAGTPAVKGTDYTLTFSNDSTDVPAKANEAVTINFTETYIGANAHAGDSVVVHITATITDTDGTYSNSATNDKGGRSDDVDITSGSLTINKTDNASHPLSGAVFNVYKDDSETPLQFVKVSDGVYALAMPGDEETSKDVTTVASGSILIEGLDAGEYHIVETKAPDGYQIEIVEDTKAIVAGGTEDIVFDVIDDQLASLPETGGIGTTIFTIGGCIIMIAAAGLFFASRRKSSK